jgi:ribosome-binding ATPase YchF (GTP1/OBG family)
MNEERRKNITRRIKRWVKLQGDSQAINGELNELEKAGHDTEEMEEALSKIVRKIDKVEGLLFIYRPDDYVKDVLVVLNELEGKKMKGNEWLSALRATIQGTQEFLKISTWMDENTKCLSKTERLLLSGEIEEP